MIDSVVDHINNFSKYNPLSGSRYIKLPKGLDHPKKGLINIQNFNHNECFKLCLVRYLHLADHNLATIRKIDNKESNEKYPIYVSKITFKRHVDVLLIEEEDKRHYALVKDFSTFIYDHTLHCGKGHFSCYCLQNYSTAKPIKSHVNDYFKISCKQMIQMPKNSECVRFKNYDREIKSPFIICADF